MTIAAGFTCNEGIVLCTDSQMTISGYMKHYRGKIRTVVTRDTVVAFAGAGTTDYVETAIEKAVDELSSRKNLEAIKKHLEATLLAFFTDHLAGWAYFPENERPTVELLIGVSTRAGGCDLFHYSGTSFYRTGSKAIGAGVLLADSLISDYCWKISTLAELVPIATFIVSKIKDEVDTCGGFTDMVLLREGADFALAGHDDIEKLEKQIKATERRSVESLKTSIAKKRMPYMWMRDAVKPRRATHSAAHTSAGKQ